MQRGLGSEKERSLHFDGDEMDEVRMMGLNGVVVDSGAGEAKIYLRALLNVYPRVGIEDGDLENSLLNSELTKASRIVLKPGTGLGETGPGGDLRSVLFLQVTI